LQAYFQACLKKGKLNKYESIELVRPVLMQGKAHMIDNWITNNQLELSEELGDIVKQHDQNKAIEIYKKAGADQKLT
jgi:clathrin heavy chain